MTKHLTVLTGGSRGLGLAMAQQLLKRGDTLLCISRQTSDTLPAFAEAAGATLLQWSQDLAHGDKASTRLEQWLHTQADKEFTHVTLINNAGVIGRIEPLSQTDPVDLAHSLRVGLEAPMQLTAAFLRATGDWHCERSVLNISSGLGRRPMASQAAYCAAKAGLDHFTRCLALDEAGKPFGAKVCSLAPGVIDTDMQVQLRSARPELFPDQAGFASLKSQGQLISPEAAAGHVLAYLARPDFGSQSVADVRDAS
ncbi:MAG: SDR family NAD(P)-dependent oxidoreductase [Rhodoferax sp.]|nr:SDR family NAD(P)-dependent oxidoreductase [Rhodoferax sp.]